MVLIDHIRNWFLQEFVILLKPVGITVDLYWYSCGSNPLTVSQGLGLV